MKKIIDELINNSIEGVDVYRYKNATWLIFTDENRWVVELTDEGTLWYNYKFFNDVFKYVSMTVGQEMEGYVIQWANDYFYKDCAHRSIAYPRDKGRNETPKVVEGGIKKTEQRGKNHGNEFEWHTRAIMNNGIKDIKPNIMDMFNSNSHLYYDHDCNANKTDIWKIVEEGIKNIYPDQNSGDYDWSNEFEADKVIERGVKV